MMAEALYRKYRPATFAEVVGQDAIERTLRNAIAQDKVSHAYLFCGPRGTGKTTTARLLAKALLCEQGPTPTPDGTCEQCEDIARGVHPDVYELDAASRTGVDNVREEIIGRVIFAPTRGRYKIYIIDEVHMLSVAAFNALLKTLEEPPAHVVFVLCTTDPQKVPATIISRCQRFDFKRIGTEEIAARLAVVCEGEGVTADPDALALLAEHARGGMRDALTALEAVIAHDAGAVTLAGARDVVGEGDADSSAELLEAVAVRDVPRCFAWTESAAAQGVDFMAAAGALAADIRDLYVMAAVGDTRNAGGFGLSAARVEALRRVSGTFGVDRAARALAVLGDAMTDLKTSANPRLSFEIALVRLARPTEDASLEALAERVEALEMRAVAPAAAAVVPVSAPVAGASAAPVSVPGKPAAATKPAPAAPAPVRAVAAAQVAPPAPAAPVATAAIPAASAASATSAAPAAPAAPDTAEVLTEARLNAVWPQVMAQLHKLSPAASALFVNATPRPAANGGMDIVFAAEKSFALNAAQFGSNKANLEAALSRVFGRKLPFSLRLEGEGAVTPNAATPPVRPAVPPTLRERQAPAPVAAPASPAYEPALQAEEDVPYDDAGYSEAVEPTFAPKEQSADASMANFFANFGATFEEYE